MESLLLSSHEKQIEKVAMAREMQQLKSELLISHTESDGLSREAEVLRSSVDRLRAEVSLKVEESGKLKQEQDRVRLEMNSMKLNAADLQRMLDKDRRHRTLAFGWRAREA